MNKIELYEQLDSAMEGTAVVDGLVLLNRNNNKWHLCSKSGEAVMHDCGNGSPTNPSPADPFYDPEHYRSSFESSAEVSKPAQALQKSRLCSFCERNIEAKFEMKRVVIATTPDESRDVERFKRKRQQVRENE
jgi:hypothetical protein